MVMEQGIQALPCLRMCCDRLFKAGGAVWNGVQMEGIGAKERFVASSEVTPGLVQPGEAWPIFVPGMPSLV